jgi:peptide/nickel transport system substrate-binding protein
MHRRSFLLGSGALGSAAGFGGSLTSLLNALPAEAAEADTIVAAIGEAITTLDVMRTGISRASYQISVNCYDRLISFGTKSNPDGTVTFDSTKLQPELAESWEVAPDGLSITFKLRPDAVFSDGTPVTAEDVKWSLDRSIGVGGFPPIQMAAGRMEKMDQFEIVDAKTFRVKLNKKTKLTLLDLAVPIPSIYNSKVAKANATAADPWALEYLHRNTAGSGAFVVEKWEPGQQVVYVRNDKWKGGPLPKVRRVILREIPNQSTRRSLLERGDINIAFDIPGKTAKELLDNPKVKVIGQPIANTLLVLFPNLNFEPFRDKNVRQAIAHAIPYEQIFQQAAFGRGTKMYGAKSAKPTDTTWPQPFPYDTDLAKAKELMAKSAYKDGFDTQLGFEIATSWGEPTALLIKEGLEQIGIRCALERVPAANWRTVALVQKKIPLVLEGFGGWIDTLDYYFFFCFKKSIFCAAEYENPEMNALIDKTLDMASDDPEYAPSVKRMMEIAFEDVVRYPLWQPWLEAAMVPTVAGYQNWFHRGLDIRPLSMT